MDKRDGHTVRLGIDIGTTSVCVVVADWTDNGEHKDHDIVILHSATMTSEAYEELSNTRAIQSPQRILDCLSTLLEAIPRETRSRIQHIGLTGQMHGCMLWKASEEGAFHATTSPLATWEDKRCSPEFLSSIGAEQSPSPVNTGYGCATLCWYHANEPSQLARYDRAGHIQDYIAFLLTSCASTVMDPTQAHSWGFFDVSSSSFDVSGMESAYRQAVSPFIPKVVPCGSDIGSVTTEAAARWFLPAGCRVHVPSGDHQSHVHALLGRLKPDEKPEHVLMMNIGTSAQLSLLLPKSTVTAQALSAATKKGSPYEYRPCFNPKYLLLTCASLNGGNALAHLVQSVRQWCESLGATMPGQDEMYSSLLGMAEQKAATDLKFNPVFHGERHEPQKRASVQNISVDNFSLGDLVASLCSGLIANLRSMLPQDTLRSVHRVIGSGNALTRNVLLQRIIEEQLGVRLSIEVDAEAASGIMQPMTLSTL